MRLGSASIIRANSRNLPLADNCVDLVVTSPPYFALRSYQDGGEHYAGQIGDEPTPAEFVDSLLEVTRECVRVLKPSGSLWVNLGDKYAGSGMGGNTSLANSADYIEQRAKGYHPEWNTAASDTTTEPESSATTSAPARPASRKDLAGVRTKSLIGIPWRYALRCIDDLGLILRAEVIWSKPNGLPESVTDRVRRSHEQWFHFTLQPRYFSAVDEIRTPAVRTDERNPSRRYSEHVTMPGTKMHGVPQNHPLGSLPGSVWTVPTEPLRVPDHLGIDHFAAFPTEWPKRIIQGWSPAGVCVECGEGRRPVGEKAHTITDASVVDKDRAGLSNRHLTAERGRRVVSVSLTGYACACPDPTAPTTSAVVLDPCGGTGTTAMVAKALGRHGISVDMSADYCRLAEWRTNDRDQLAKVLGVAKVEQQPEDQLSMFDLLGDGAA